MQYAMAGLRPFGETGLCCEVFDRQGEALNGFRASTGFLLHVFSRFEFYG